MYLSNHAEISRSIHKIFQLSVQRQSQALTYLENKLMALEILSSLLGRKNALSKRAFKMSQTVQTNFKTLLEICVGNGEIHYTTFFMLNEMVLS